MVLRSSRFLQRIPPLSHCFVFAVKKRPRWPWAIGVKITSQYFSFPCLNRLSFPFPFHCHYPEARNRTSFFFPEITPATQVTLGVWIQWGILAKPPMCRQSLITTRTHSGRKASPDIQGSFTGPRENRTPVNGRA